MFDCIAADDNENFAIEFHVQSHEIQEVEKSEFKFTNTTQDVSRIGYYSDNYEWETLWSLVERRTGKSVGDCKSSKASKKRVLIQILWCA